MWFSLKESALIQKCQPQAGGPKFMPGPSPSIINTGGHSGVHQFGKHLTFGPESIDPLCLLMRTPGWNVRLPTDTPPPP